MEVNQLILLLDKYSDKPWYWGQEGLSRNPSITPEFIEKNPDKPWYWGHNGLSSNPSITPELVEKFQYKPWDWGNCGLSMNPSITPELVEKSQYKPWCWGRNGLSGNTFSISNEKIRIKRDKAARIIQNGCYNWLFKPVCKDGTVGIFPRLS